MTPLANNPQFDEIVDALAEQQYIILDKVLPDELLASLDQHFQSLDQQEFKQAGIGRSDKFHTNQKIRSDLIRWLDRESDATSRYFDWMEALRQRVNQEFFLGLFDYECHYAHFPEGSFYQRHVDAFRGQSNRRLTTILYLNHDWQPSDGGELKIYRHEETEPFARVLPEYGRMVIFLSEEFPHEVCVALRSRRSVTGWFRINNSSSQTTDPIR